MLFILLTMLKLMIFVVFCILLRPSFCYLIISYFNIFEESTQNPFLSRFSGNFNKTLSLP